MAPGTEPPQEDTVTHKPISETVPLDRAWQEGRRIYVRCGYKSTLNQQMRQLGARWDPDQRALWVGSTKKPAVLVLVAEAAERADRVARVKDLGLWVAIPRGMASVREQAKQLGLLFDGDRKEWAAPTRQAQEKVERLVAEQRAAKRAERDQAERESAELEERIAAERGRPTQEVTAQVLAERSGRRATGELVSYRWVSTRRMRSGDARGLLHRVGEVIELDDGRHGVVVEAEAWFTDDERASSMCWHDETADQAHWDLWHRVAVVEDTADEAAERQERRERAEDAVELHALWHASGQGPAAEGTRVVPESELVGSIQLQYGTGHTRHDGGTLILAANRVVFNHPGWYDDYRATWRESRDEELVARVRAAIVRGVRERVFVDQMEYVYRVSIQG